MYCPECKKEVKTKDVQIWDEDKRQYNNYLACIECSEILKKEDKDIK